MRHKTTSLLDKGDKALENQREKKFQLDSSGPTYPHGLGVEGPWLKPKHNVSEKLTKATFTQAVRGTNL